MIKFFWLLFFFILLVDGKVENSLGEDPLHYLRGNIRRLTGDLRPTNYIIVIQPFFDAPGVEFDPAKNGTFEGEVLITTIVQMPTSKIILNAKDLTFPESPTIQANSATTFPRIISINKFSKTPENETITFELAEDLKPGDKVRISIKFAGKIGLNSEVGFYKSEKNGEFVYATHFQTHGARSVFPCFDEPEFKATFKLILFKPKPWTALSNGIEHRFQNHSNGFEIVYFQETEEISTYMVAFAMGDLVKIEQQSDDGILHRIWTTKFGERKMKSALKTAIKCTEVLTNYTNFPIKIRKIDHLAIPNKKAAMENPGLLIYDQRILLFDDDEEISFHFGNRTAYELWLRNTRTICHELAHQWFGNLVTNKWWSDVWLHEGFANFFETFSMALAYPEEADLIGYSTADRMFRKVINDANSLLFDEHPVITQNGEFDFFSYCMGGAILRQLEAVISPAVLQKGIQRYLRKFAYSNVDTSEFLAEIQKVVDETELKDWCGEAFDVSKFMSPWLTQIGYPMLVADFEDGVFTFSQKNQYKGDWPLPVFFQLENGQKEMRWIAPNYTCKNGTTLGSSFTIGTSALFVNPDMTSITDMAFFPKAATQIYQSLAQENGTLQISVASFPVIKEKLMPYLNVADAMGNIKKHQKSAKIFEKHFSREQ